jgi:hypothetical protein
MTRRSLSFRAALRRLPRTKTMIAIIKHVYESIVDAVKFTSAVWHDARSMQAEAEAKYGHIGF